MHPRQPGDNQFGAQQYGTFPEVGIFTTSFALQLQMDLSHAGSPFCAPSISAKVGCMAFDFPS